MDSAVYILEIYYPQSRQDVWRTFESSTPFMSFHEGDIVDPSSWSGSRSPLRVLRVTEVHHALSERNEQLQHKLEVFTEEIMVYETPDEG
jgi:hypothetical protein